MQAEQSPPVVPEGSQDMPPLVGGSIKTILVPVSGSETDRTVCTAALAVARPLQAHLEFLHLHLPGSTAEAADVSGAKEGTDTVRRLHHANLAVSAAHYVLRFCHEHGIDCGVPAATRNAVSATCVEENGPPIETLLSHARHSDLVILGRRQHADCIPPTLVGDLLMESGRPLLLLPPMLRRELLGNVVIGWKEGSQAAHAVSAALPLLRLAKRVFLVNVIEDRSTGIEALEQVRRQLLWHDIAAHVHRIGESGVSAAVALPQAAEDLKAGLLIVGGFSHSRIRETVFGGVTQHLMNAASLPVLMAH